MTTQTNRNRPHAVTDRLPADPPADGKKPAAEQHLIDFTAVLKDPYGEPFMRAEATQLAAAILTAAADLEKAFDPDEAVGKVAKQLRASLEGKEITLGYACVAALNFGLESDRGEEETAKPTRFMLACKIVSAEESRLPMALIGKNITLLKKRIAGTYPNASLVGRVWSLIEPNSPTE